MGEGAAGRIGNWIMIQKDKVPVSKTIVDYEDDDPDVVSMEEARSLVGSVGRDPGMRFFEKLQSRD